MAGGGRRDQSDPGAPAASNPFFDHPILNSPYAEPSRHWELEDGQPTQRIIEARRRAEFITPIPKPKTRERSSAQQGLLPVDDGKGLSTKEQQYDPTSIINEVRGRVDCRWPSLTRRPRQLCRSHLRDAVVQSLSPDLRARRPFEARPLEYALTGKNRS